MKSAGLSRFLFCKNCQYHPLSMSGLRAVSAYQEPLRACIRALKYNGNTRLAEPLGQLLARAYTSYGLHADIMRLSVCGYPSPGMGEGSRHSFLGSGEGQEPRLPP